MQSLYEYAVMRDMQDGVTRPGGLGLTGGLLDYCDLNGGSQVLDLGCGCAASLRFVKEKFDCKIYGLDIARQLLLQARRRHSDHSLIQANIFAIPFALNTFDLILLECVATIFSIEKCLSICKRLLKPGGKILLADLYARKADGLNEIRQLPKRTCIQGVIMHEDILRALETFGFKLVHWKDYSETMENFPMKTLSTSLQINLFDLVMAANSVDLGYYGLIAELKTG